MDERVKSYFMNSKQELVNKFGKNISNNTSLSNYSWFNLGGPAEFLLNQKIKIN